MCVVGSVYGGRAVVGTMKVNQLFIVVVELFDFFRFVAK